jgi:hypothetical protein
LGIDNNNNNSYGKLKLNPKYEVQIRGLTPCEYKMLRNSMQMVGQRIPIIADKDGNIIDGHHRFKICMELGIEPEFETQDFESEEQKLKTIIDVNSARRHYNKWELFESVMTKKPVIEAEVKAEQQLKYPKAGEKGLKPIPIGVKDFTPIDINKIANNDCNLTLEKNNHDSASNRSDSNRVNKLLGKMMDVSHTTISTWEYVKNNANEKQIEDLRNGKVTANKVAAHLKAAEKQRQSIQQAKFINSKYLLPDQATIYCGDFRDPAILAKIPDGSASLILLDPFYAEEYWYLYEALPPIVMAKLKPNGHFVSLFGDTLKRKFMNILEADGLIYNTDISIQLQGPFSHDQHLHISRKKKDFLWYYKGPELITNGLLQNLIPSERSDKDLHKMQQSTKEAEEIISRLTFPDTGDVVLDLMMGSGTNIKAALNCSSGRKGIGIEINQVTCEKARAYITGSFLSDTG